VQAVAVHLFAASSLLSAPAVLTGTVAVLGLSAAQFLGSATIQSTFKAAIAAFLSTVYGLSISASDVSVSDVVSVINAPPCVVMVSGCCTLNL
jgi:hypothetical protein